MKDALPVISLIVNIIQTIGVTTLALIIMSIYKENFKRQNSTADKVEEVRKTLEISSATLAQEATLKSLEGKTLVMEDKVDDLNNKLEN